MKKFMITLLLLGVVAVLVPGCLRVTDWRESDATSLYQYEEELTITAAGGADTTRFFPGHKVMTVAFKPGYSTTNNTFHSDTDSCVVDVYVEGWTDKSGGTCLGSMQLFNPLQVVGLITSTNADSASRTVDVNNGKVVSLPFSDYTAGTGDWDSLRIDLVDIKNTQLPSLWPWVRVIISDADTATGVNYAAKVVLIGAD